MKPKQNFTNMTSSRTADPKIVNALDVEIQDIMQLTAILHSSKNLLTNHQ